MQTLPLNHNTLNYFNRSIKVFVLNEFSCNIETHSIKERQIIYTGNGNRWMAGKHFHCWFTPNLTSPQFSINQSIIAQKQKQKWANASMWKEGHYFCTRCGKHCSIDTPQLYDNLCLSAHCITELHARNYSRVKNGGSSYNCCVTRNTWLRSILRETVRHMEAIFY